MGRQVLLGGLFASWLACLVTGCVPNQLVKEPDPLAVSQQTASIGVAQAPRPPDISTEPPFRSPYHAQTLDLDNQPAAAAPERVGGVVNPSMVTAVGPPPMELSATSAPANPSAIMPIIITGSTTVPMAPESCVLEAMRAVQEKLPEDEIRRRLSRLDKNNQDLLLRLLTLTNRLGERGAVEGLNPQDMGKFLQQVDEISAGLRIRAPLLLPKVCFCRKIESFGFYDPLPNPAFQAGVDEKPGELVLLYVEVRNFGRRDCGRNYSETALACKLEIQEWRLLRPQQLDSGTEVDSGQSDSPPAKALKPCVTYDLHTHHERSLSPRQDYFIKIGFNIPPNLAPGHYTLSVEVRDDIGIDPVTGQPRTARTKIDFQVVGSNSLTQERASRSPRD
jgi:hypothetical protein